MALLQLHARRHCDGSRFAGQFMDSSHYDTILDGPEDVDVFKPDGTPLLKVRRDVLSKGLCDDAWQMLRKLNSLPDNRGMATGYAKEMSEGAVRSDGKRSRTNRVPREAVKGTSSAIIGYFDRYTRFPFCRTTKYTADHPLEWARLVPLLQEIDGVFAAELPDRHGAQLDAVMRTHPDYRIGVRGAGRPTAFSTLTVNRNWRTACHTDSGDLAAGFGVMVAFRAGRFTGGHLVFPAYRTAVAFSTGDVLLADVHEYHGNTAMVGAKDRWERVSLVCYFRENLPRCKGQAEEVEIAKRRKKGDPLW